MRNNWIIISLILGLIGSAITFYLTGDWRISGLVGFIVLIISFYLSVTIYIKAFFIIILPVLSKFIFTFQFKTENFNIEAGLKEFGEPITLFLLVIALFCLVFYFLENNNKLKGFLININKPSIRGNNNFTQQIINKKD